jgi:hypothetical protein
VYVDKENRSDKGTVYIRIKPNVATPVKTNQGGQRVENPPVNPQPSDTAGFNQDILDQTVG